MPEEKTHRKNTENAEPALVRIDFNDLIAGAIKEDTYKDVATAFGFDGLGGIIVTNAPGFRETKERVQRNLYQLSKESKEVLESITKTDESGAHEIGWSKQEVHAPFGKSTNKLATFNQGFHSGIPYKNAIFEDPRFGKEREAVWPATIPEFEQDLTELNNLFIPSLLGLLKYFDRYLSERIGGYEQGKFVNSFSNHYVNSHRLLAYFPLDEFETNTEDQHIWENWHIDHGVMTALSHPIYFTRQGENYELDNTALALKDRHGQEHRAIFSQDEFIIITAAAMFIESAGYVPGTPHTVKISEGMPTDLYRIQAVSFFEPDMNHRMSIPTEESFEEIVERDPRKYEYRDTDFYEEGCYFKEFNDEISKTVYNLK